MTHTILSRLDAVCEDRGARLQRPLVDLMGSIESDMDAIDTELRRVDATADAPAEQSVRHLLAQRGKRLRPMCVALAARTGKLGFTPVARSLAVAAELVHAATLLHDDVVDVGDLRRGVPTARIIYGNAASIFGGDWLLVEAIRRIQEANIPSALDEALIVLRSMVEAESLQLAARGRVDTDRAAYLHVADGKTASLFAWALGAGAKAGGAARPAVVALESFGRHLGLAFQVIDDTLDLAAEQAIGKTALSDVREGKMTFPLVVALERDPRIRPWLVEACASERAPDALLEEIAVSVRGSGAIEESRDFARLTTARAIAFLDEVAPCSARDALIRAATELTTREL